MSPILKMSGKLMCVKFTFYLYNFYLVLCEEATHTILSQKNCLETPKFLQFHF